MPIHDWRRVDAGIFHHFHHEWISTISRRLNASPLPPGLYALSEPIAGGFHPGVLALAHLKSPGRGKGSNGKAKQLRGDGGTAVADAPPKVSVHI